MAQDENKVNNEPYSGSYYNIDEDVKNMRTAFLDPLSVVDEAQARHLSMCRHEFDPMNCPFCYSYAMYREKLLLENA